MKLFIKLLLLVAVTAYLIFTFSHITQRGDNSVCSSVKVAIADSLHGGFITEQEVEHLLKKGKQYPVGLVMDSINGKAIETLLKKNPFIKDAVCYKTPGGRVNIIITQRLPVLRIMTESGEDFYIDENGKKMNAGNYMADLTIATGNIDADYARKYLVPLGKYLHGDEFWNNQIEQIYVTDEKNVELVPRVGNQIIEIGVPEDMEDKLKNLEQFYRKVMPTVGWNKYSKINIEYDNQIICTKK